MPERKTSFKPTWNSEFHFAGEICDTFLCFFLDKIKTIRSSLDKSPVANVRPLVIVSNVLSSFQHVCLPALSDMVSGMRPSSCPHDIVPAIVLKSSFTSLGLSIQSIKNLSLDHGVVPACFKHAAVQPLLKKPNLDQASLNNYRPVSRLPFLSKLLEKVVLSH